MPRVLSPPRRRRTDNSDGFTQTSIQTSTPTSIQTSKQTLTLNQIIKPVVAVAIIVCLILFCGIQDTLRYLEFIIVLLGTVVITVASVMKSNK